MAFGETGPAHWANQYPACEAIPEYLDDLEDMNRHGLQSLVAKLIQSVLPLPEVMPGCNSHEKDTKHLKEYAKLSGGDSQNGLEHYRQQPGYPQR